MQICANNYDVLEEPEKSDQSESKADYYVKTLEDMINDLQADKEQKVSLF